MFKNIERSVFDQDYRAEVEGYSLDLPLITIDFKRGDHWENSAYFSKGVFCCALATAFILPFKTS